MEAAAPELRASGSQRYPSAASWLILVDDDVFSLKGVWREERGQELGLEGPGWGLTLRSCCAPPSAGLADRARAPTHLASPEGAAAEIHSGDQG